MRLLPELYLLLILLSSYGAQSYRIKRADDNDSTENKPPGTGGPQTENLKKLLNGFVESSRKIPIIGSFVHGQFEQLVVYIIEIEILTNGGISGFLSYVLPCEISIEKGFFCKGIQTNGGLFEIMSKSVDFVPNLLMPQFTKSIVKLAIQGLKQVAN